jgi:hypothetical protein
MQIEHRNQIYLSNVSDYDQTISVIACRIENETFNRKVLFPRLPPRNCHRVTEDDRQLMQRELT